MGLLLDTNYYLTTDYTEEKSTFMILNFYNHFSCKIQGSRMYWVKDLAYGIHL